MNLENMKEVYGDDIIDIISSNMELIEINIKVLKEFGFNDVEGIFERHPIMFTYFTKSFKEKIENLINEMTMKDWLQELDSFLTMTRKEILQGKGVISHEQALKNAHEEYEKYTKNNLTRAEKDYLLLLGEDIKELKD